MKALLSFILPVFLAAGCLSGDFNAPDQGAPVPDMATTRMFDLAGYDLLGLYNCAGLNACERACTTKACVLMCRMMATPTAVALQNDLEGCFVQNCPIDPGKVCAGDMTGMVSMACNVCIANTYIPQNSSCSPTQNPDECHQCVAQANACTADM